MFFIRKTLTRLALNDPISRTITRNREQVRDDPSGMGVSSEEGVRIYENGN